MKGRQRLMSVLLGAAVGVPAFFILSSLLLIINGLTDNIHKADVAVVLGNKVELNGQPSNRLKARLDKTIQLFKAELFTNVIVSGGLGVEGFDEAVVMKQYLSAHGLPNRHIYLDSKGLTTYLTAKNSTELMKHNGWKSVLVISQYFHIPRTRLAFEQFGISPVYSAHAEFFELRDIYSTTREVIGYGFYLLRRYN
jgi:vancomycin permeability regulator SanA